MRGAPEPGHRQARLVLDEPLYLAELLGGADAASGVNGDIALGPQVAVVFQVLTQVSDHFVKGRSIVNGEIDIGASAGYLYCACLSHRKFPLRTGRCKQGRGLALGEYLLHLLPYVL